MRHPSQRMDTGIGAARASERDALSRERANGVGQGPCTDTPSAWICQPTKGVPSYSMVMR